MTPAELAALNTIASGFAAQEGSLTQQCVTQAAAPGASSNTVALTFGDGTSLPIYSYDTTTGQLCFYGTQAAAQGFFTAMDALASKYSVTATPSPSPSVSPTVTPTVTPTITPTPAPTKIGTPVFNPGNGDDDDDHGGDHDGGDHHQH